MIAGRVSNRFRDVAGAIKIYATDRRRTFVALIALTVIGFFYDRLFFNYYHAFLSDDGSVALIAEKLLNGERPYIDIEIGYGIVWFLPIVYLFKVFGVKFFLVRIYFLVIAFASSLFAYGLLLCLTANRLVAFVAAFLVLLFPGCLYQTYIPFLVISGAYVVLLYDARTLESRMPSWLALTCNGLYLGFAYLIRGDIATVYSFLFLFYHGLLTLRAAILKGNARALVALAVRVIGVASVAGLVGLAFALQARSAGYLEGFVHQYLYFGEQAIRLIGQRFLTDSPVGTSVVQALWPRPKLLSFFSVDGRHGFIFLTYAPILALFVICLFLAAELYAHGLNAAGFSDFIAERAQLIVLTGGAFSAFGQFFVWRPDAPHLAGFVPGFVMLMTYFLFVVRRKADVPQKFRPTRRRGFWLLSALCATYLVAFALSFEDGLNLRRDRLSRLRSEKGIDIYLRWDDFQIARQLDSIIREASRPDEFVLCFSYCPGINFLTNRPTFQKFLYVDDSFLVTRPDWLDEMRKEIELKRPRVIVIDDLAVNLTEISRFRNWANALYDYINRTYERRAVVDGHEVFVHR